MSDRGDTIARINAQRDTLPAGQKAIASYIAEHIAEVPHLSIQSIAQQVGVSTASVSRLARKLGYADFRELKIHLAQNSRASVSTLFEELSQSDSDHVLVKKVFAANMRSLEATLNGLDIAQFVTLSRSLLRASNLVFFGTGSSGHIAQDAALRFCHVGISAEACTEPILALARGSMLGRSDMAIAISHSGRSSLTVTCMQNARGNGAMTVCITNYPESPLAEMCDQVLCTAFCETAVRSISLSSRAAQVSILDALYLLTARQMEDLGDVLQLSELIEASFRIPDKRHGPNHP